MSQGAAACAAFAMSAVIETSQGASWTELATWRVNALSFEGAMLHLSRAEHPADQNVQLTVTKPPPTPTLKRLAYDAAKSRYNKRQTRAAHKICATVHPDWRLAPSDDVATVTSMFRHLHRKETNMLEMTKLAHPIELSDEELDLVAAGTGGCGCQDGGSLIRTGDINVLSGNQVQVGVLSKQSQIFVG
jgi:hypothetical protein